MDGGDDDDNDDDDDFDDFDDPLIFSTYFAQLGPRLAAGWAGAAGETAGRFFCGGEGTGAARAGEAADRAEGNSTDGAAGETAAASGPAMWRAKR